MGENVKVSLDTALRQRAWSNRKVCSCYRTSGLLGNIYSFVFCFFHAGWAFGFFLRGGRSIISIYKKAALQNGIFRFYTKRIFRFFFPSERTEHVLNTKKILPGRIRPGFSHTKKRRSVKDGVFQNTFGSTRILRYPSVCEVACGNV